MHRVDALEGPTPIHRAGGLTEGLLAGTAVIWLVATLVAAHASVVGNAADPDVSLAAAAFALPNLVAAGLVSGAGVALLTVGRVAADAPALRRLVAGLIAGAVLGGLCA